MIAIVRLIIFTWVVELMEREPMTFVMDVTWYSSGVLFWHLAENVVGLIGCCLPTYRPLFKQYLPKLKLGSSNKSHGDSKGFSQSDKTPQFQRRPEDELPLSATTKVTGEPSSSSDEERGMAYGPPDGIVVQKEFGTDSMPRAL